MIDFNKPLQTIYGFKVNITNFNRKDPHYPPNYPLEGNILDHDGSILSKGETWTKEGYYCYSDKGNIKNLMNVPEKLETMKININKKYITAENNFPVEILKIDINYPTRNIIGVIKTNYKQDIPSFWNSEGKNFETEFWNLVEVPVKKWVNIYLPAVGYSKTECYFYNTKDEADKAASSDRIACIEIDIKSS
jgi:hypothetical protein